MVELNVYRGEVTETEVDVQPMKNDKDVFCTKDDINKKVGVLSGGEKNRVGSSYGEEVPGYVG